MVNDSPNDVYPIHQMVNDSLNGVYEEAKIGSEAEETDTLYTIW